MRLDSIYKKVDFSSLADEMLLKRMEIKFFFPAAKLEAVHRLMASKFQIISFNGVLKQTYNSLYQDTSTFKHYLDHHNGRKNRFKIRFRHYRDAELTFLEVKRKTNNGFTIKSRLPIPYDTEEITEEATRFLSKTYSGNLADLQDSIRTRYQRISLVTADHNARITLDQNLSFEYKNKASSLKGLAVLELKYNQEFSYHYLRKGLKELGIYPEQVSKYCLGVCYLIPGIKKNNFKTKLRKIQNYNQTQLCY